MTESDKGRIRLEFPRRDYPFSLDRDWSVGDVQSRVENVRERKKEKKCLGEKEIKKEMSGKKEKKWGENVWDEREGKLSSEK